MDIIHISFMELGDVQDAVKVLSLAMLNNPLHMAIFKGNGENERREIEKIFFELFTKLPGIVFLAKEHQNIVGVMRMKSCVGSDVGDESNGLKDKNSIEWRKSVWQREWSTKDPKEQHWHLGPIGVLPSYRKMGIGSRLMERFCGEVDACSATAYLETDLDENVRFYEKFGFNVVSQSDILQVNNRFMVRDPQR